MVANEALIAADPKPRVSQVEIDLILEGIFALSGFDFRDYVPSYVKRRVVERMRAEGVPTVTRLLDLIVHDPAVLERTLYHLTVIPNTPFRDVHLFEQLAARVIPRLRTYPFFRLWVAGSGNGADAYALAILLHEAQLSHRVRIYATESTESAIDEAKSGIVASEGIRLGEDRYRQAGGKAALSDYVEEGPGGLQYAGWLRENILFARHHLPADGSFNEFHAVIARTALTSYGRTLAYRVHQTLHESVARWGFLCLGSRETIQTGPHQGAYERLDGAESVFRRLR
jgi:chemotaxis protein methyltransferase CheR